MRSDFQLANYDVIDTCSELRPDSFDACFCDPPYGLKFMGKRWDHGVPGVDYWQAILRVLKPGAPILAFGGTRTYHRLACAIEDAGFSIFDSILASVWVHGQGFPKSLDIAKAINKAERASDARLWDGYGTALKPAWEPIIFARKPLDGTYADNCLEYDCGGLNINGCRIDTNGEAIPYFSTAGGVKFVQGRTQNVKQAGTRTDGRYPSNLILSHHPECDKTCHSDCPVRLLDEQSGERKSGGVTHQPRHGGYGFRPDRDHGTSVYRLPDTGGASRFYYCAKVSSAERNAGTIPGTCVHPTLKPLALTTYLACLILPPTTSSRLLIPFCGTGSEIAGSLIAGWSYILGIDNDRESISIAHRRIPALLKHSRSKGL